MLATPYPGLRELLERCACGELRAGGVPAAQPPPAAVQEQHDGGPVGRQVEVELERTRPGRAA